LWACLIKALITVSVSLLFTLAVGKRRLPDGYLCPSASSLARVLIDLFYSRRAIS
jgi:hypothetical protein